MGDVSAVAKLLGDRGSFTYNDTAKYDTRYLIARPLAIRQKSGDGEPRITR